MDVVKRAAGDLIGAYETGVPVEPLTGKYEELTLEDAYAIQLAQIEEFTAKGARIKGHKVGLTSVAMQRQLGVDRPDYGHLLDSMFHLDGAPIDAGRFLQPRIEPEIAFVLRRPLSGPGVTAAEAAAAVDFALPALEIIDSRIRDWKITLPDTVADNASSGGVVLGTRPVPLHEIDPRLASCLLHRNGELVSTGAAAAVLGSPLNALVWLADTLGARGVSLEAGNVILPGAIVGAEPVAAGDIVTAEFAGLGTVTASFRGASC